MFTLTSMYGTLLDVMPNGTPLEAAKARAVTTARTVRDMVALERRDHRTGPVLRDIGRATPHGFVTISNGSNLT